MPQRFLKSDLIDYNNCKKSAWLKRNDHEVVNWPKQTAFEQILAMDGYVAEDLAQNMLSSLLTNLSEMREYLARENIDRDGCECIQKPSASNHCDSFDYFNPDIPEGIIGTF